MKINKGSIKTLVACIYLILVATIIIFITTLFTGNINALSSPVIGGACMLSIIPHVYTKSTKTRKAFKLLIVTYILYSPMALYFGLTGTFTSKLFLLAYLLIVFANLYLYKSLKEKKIEDLKE